MERWHGKQAGARSRVERGFLEGTGERRTAHTETVGEEITRVCHQGDYTTLDMRITSQMRVFQTQRTAQPKSDTEEHGPGEGEEENADSVK